MPDFARQAVLQIRGLDKLLAFMAFIAAFFHFFIEPLRWRIYIHALSIRTTYPSLLSLFSFIALATYMVPTKLGIPLRMFLLTRKVNIAWKTVTFYLLVDGMLSYLVWGTGAAILYLSFAKLTDIRQAGFYIIPVILVFGIGCLLRTKIKSGLDRIKDQCNLLNGQLVAVQGGLFLLDVCSFVVRHALILAAMGVTLPLHKVAYITIVSIFAGYISMMPLGIGAYDTVIVLLLTQMGVPTETAIMVPILSRTFNILSSILLGLPSSFVLGLSLGEIVGKINKGGHSNGEIKS